MNCSRPVYAALTALYDNYNPDVGVKEHHTAGERREEERFLDTVMQTQVMDMTIQFLKAEKLFTKSKSEFRRLLRELWFDVYSRGKRILGSSGFEHVFLGEQKEGAVQGLHNWVFLHHLEQRGKLNYLGHWEAVKLGDQVSELFHSG